MWSFVGGKGRARWVWAALDADPRPVAAMVVGDRPEDTARRRWAAVPAGYRDRPIMCTDFGSAYRAAVPDERHAAAGKESGRTGGLERFGWTAGPRCSRLVGKTLSFSACDRNHVGALWSFIRHYNVSRR